MPKATISLEDKDGGIDFSLTFDNGFNIFSNAHQIAQLMCKHADSMLERVDAHVTPLEKQIVVVDNHHL